MEVYNLRIKTFPDGTTQYFYSDRLKRRGENSKNNLMQRWLTEHWFESDYVDFNSFEEFEKWYHDGSSIERKKYENAKRARQMIYDLARCTEWDLFVTLTFNDELADGWNYESCTAELCKFTNKIAKYGCQWLFVPEQHPTSGRWHFHGLVKGELPLEPSQNPYTGMPVLDKRGRMVYNISCYRLGWSTATYLTSSEKAAYYVCKYVTKDQSVPKHKKRYWASQKLVRPDVDYVISGLDPVLRVCATACFSKKIETEWGNFILFETKDSSKREEAEKYFSTQQNKNKVV